MRVRVELPNPGLKLKPGMYGNVTLQTDAVNTLVVPKEAVLETGLRQLVFMDRGQGRYEPAFGQAGASESGLCGSAGRTQRRRSDRFLGQFLVGRREQIGLDVEHAGHDGRIGMADWQMRGAHEGKMEGMEAWAT